MCIGIYFVDKEIVQHCKVSVKCGILTMIQTKSKNLTADFDQSHCWVTGYRWPVHILPFWRQNNL